jgi:hypothetical protein
MNRKPTTSAAAQQRAREQQAVLDRLRSGGAITGAKPANPFIGMLQNLSGVGGGAVPNLYGAKLGGQEVLLGKGGWNQTTAATGPINVGGQTWYPAQSGRDLVYKRASGNVGGQYGSIFSKDQFAAPPVPVLPGAEERAYQQEKSRIEQLTAQDPELQRYEAARLKAVAPGATAEQVQSAEDIGMQIWRQKYGTTPMGQTGGAVGSFNPLMQKTFGYQSGMAPNQLAEMQKTAAPIPVAPGALPYQMGDLGTRVSETGYDPAAYGLTPDKIEEMKKKLLQQASK